MPDLTTTLILIPPLLLALSLHEAAHAWAADRLGDPTARLQGRLTLNPLAHLDLVGTLVLIITRAFGWAKPVPVDTRNLKDPIKGMFWIASAGPASNLAQAGVWGGIIRLFGPDRLMAAVRGFGPPRSDIEQAFLLMLLFAFQINIGLAWFNLLPVPPLDGSRIALRFMGPAAARQYLAFTPFGMLALLGVFLFVPEVVWAVLGPPVTWTAYLLGGVRLF